MRNDKLPLRTFQMVILAFQFDWNVHRFIGHLLSFFRCIWNFICAYMCITHSIDMLKMYTFAKRNIHANERMQIFEYEHTFDTQIMLINSHCYWFECNHHGGVLCVHCTIAFAYFVKKLEIPTIRWFLFHILNIL